MKKALIISLALNLSIVGYLIGKRYYYSHQSFPSYDYRSVRGSIFASLTIDSTDIVFVGNSLTEAFMVNELFGPHCKNRGINQNRIIDIINRIDPIAEKHPKKIFLEGGINDISFGATPKSIAENYRLLIEKIKKQSPRTAIYVQSVLPTSRQFNQKEKVISVNEYLKRYCKECGISFIDLYNSFQKDGYLIDSLTYDGVHLNGPGYKIWAEIVRSYL